MCFLEFYLVLLPVCLVCLACWWLSVVANSFGLKSLRNSFRFLSIISLKHSGSNFVPVYYFRNLPPLQLAPLPPTILQDFFKGFDHFYGVSTSFLAKSRKNGKPS